MSLSFIALLLGFVGIAVSVNPFLKNIKNHKVKVYFSLSGWTLFIFLLGLALGFGLSKFQQMTGLAYTYL